MEREDTEVLVEYVQLLAQVEDARIAFVSQAWDVRERIRMAMSDWQKSAMLQGLANSSRTLLQEATEKQRLINEVQSGRIAVLRIAAEQLAKEDSGDPRASHLVA